MTTALTKKALLSLLAASAVAIATPTLAQDHGRHGGGYGGGYGQGHGGWNGGGNGGLNGEQARIAQRIDRAAYNGRISRREAQNLRYQLEEYQRVEWRYRRDGLSQWERRDLQQRLDRIERNLRDERWDRDGRRW
ncbi:hypothetical protein [Brevundimonas sp. NIBR11]|uniref:hypothetical protein n=1 Tax=Brevundimonas sp. NIBR11 TaxID=3015999 RepID=UPI0022EFE869|nr:hypothetical protein [Brevundimonas sp. NIBR11]WGM32115.1 hypothetical protein KKHFBJBL_02366 [Brevundimonas sp. NIBR11]